MASSTACTAGARRCRPVGECGLRGDERIELLEFDDVGPVGDDPVPPLVLCVDGGDEMLVDHRGADVSNGETLDQLAVVCWSGTHQ